MLATPITLPVKMLVLAHISLWMRSNNSPMKRSDMPYCPSRLSVKVLSANRRARFEYEILERLVAGLALTGSEVKSLRAGKATIAEAYADARGGEIWLINANIPEYLQAHRFNHPPKRPRSWRWTRKSARPTRSTIC